MDIGYFLKLMVDKGASDMFLTTGAPVNIKVHTLQRRDSRCAFRISLGNSPDSNS